MDSPEKKPKLTIDLNGPDGNVYVVIAKVVVALKESGLEDKAKELRSRVPQQHSYESVLEVCKEYADVTYEGEYRKRSVIK